MTIRNEPAATSVAAWSGYRLSSNQTNPLRRLKTLFYDCCDNLKTVKHGSHEFVIIVSSLLISQSFIRLCYYLKLQSCL